MLILGWILKMSKLYFLLKLSFRWFCGTKNFLSKMTSGGIKNKSSQDVFEELHKSEEEEKLENDEDLFEDLSPQMSQLSHSKWKFIGDCAWLMPTDGPDGNMIVNNTEADGRPSRKRYGMATFSG